MASRSEPPGFRKAPYPAQSCKTCRYMSAEKGMCSLYNYPVTKADVCNRWERGQEAASADFRWHPEAYVRKDD